MDKKPVVPQYVADFYESIKDDFEDKVYDLCVQFNNDNEELNRDVWWWFGCAVNKPIVTLVKMKLFGYEVEKEKLYTVELPNPNTTDYCVLRKNNEDKVDITLYYIDWWRDDKSTWLTESEIKQDFEWAWKLAKEV